MAVSDALSALLHFSTRLVVARAIFSLVFLPFAHEDIAIIFGAYIVVNDIMPVGLVALCIYGGMVASDFALYGIGAGARHVPWLTRLAVDDRVRGFADALKRNLFALVALCRVCARRRVHRRSSRADGRACRLGRFTAGEALLVSALYLAAHALHRGASSATRSTIVPDCGRGRSCFACWWPIGFRAATGLRVPGRSQPDASPPTAGGLPRGSTWHRTRTPGCGRRMRTD